MAFDLATAKNKYDTYRPLAAATITAQNSLAALGTRPILPEIVDDNTDVSTVLTAQATYDTTHATRVAAVNTAKAAERVAELALIAEIPPNLWVKLDKTPTYLVWVGYYDQAGQKYDKIQVKTVEPTDPPAPL